VALVQFAHLHGYDNRYILDASHRHSDRLVAIACIDGARPDADQTLKQLCTEEGAAGIRLTAPTPLTVDGVWLCNDALWRAAAELGSTLCVCLPRRNSLWGLSLLGSQMRRFPDVSVLLDHAGFPQFHPAAPDFGLRPLLALAALKQLYLKLTTLTLDDLARKDVEVQPVFDRLLESFGASRMAWGSDVPNAPGDYPNMLGRMRAALSRHDKTDQEWFFERTALRLYPKLGRHCGFHSN
jgi:predicted TIM-barrel fold metal-dependent hydrolase